VGREDEKYAHQLWDVLMPYVQSLPATEPALLHNHTVEEILGIAFMACRQAAKSFKSHMGVPFVLWFRRYLQGLLFQSEEREHNKSFSGFEQYDVHEDFTEVSKEYDVAHGEGDFLMHICDTLDSESELDAVIKAYIECFQSDKAPRLMTMVKVTGIKAQRIAELIPLIRNRLSELYI